MCVSVSVKEPPAGHRGIAEKRYPQVWQWRAVGTPAGKHCGGDTAPLHIECSGCRVIGGTKLDGLPSGERLSSLTIIIFTHLLSADADVLAGSTDHRVPTQRMASS